MLSSGKTVQLPATQQNTFPTGAAWLPDKPSCLHLELASEQRAWRTVTQGTGCGAGNLISWLLLAALSLLLRVSQVSFKQKEEPWVVWMPFVQFGKSPRQRPGMATRRPGWFRDTNHQKLWRKQTPFCGRTYGKNLSFWLLFQMDLRVWNWNIIAIPSKSTQQWFLALLCKGLMTLAAARLGASGKIPSPA